VRGLLNCGFPPKTASYLNLFQKASTKQYVISVMDKSYYQKRTVSTYIKTPHVNEVKDLGTEIQTFTSIKELTEFLTNQTSQYKALFEDYSQWLGTVLRDCETTHKNEEWYQKSAALQKTLKSQSKKPPEPAAKGKKGAKGAKGKEEPSCWVQSGDIAISFTEQGQTEILFEAIEKIGKKMQEFEKFKVTVQQLSRLGLGTTVNYIVYIEEDVPKKIVLKQKSNAKGDEAFKFMTELSVPAYCSTVDNP
jgi:hypothetical protein